MKKQYGLLLALSFVLVGHDGLIAKRKDAGATVAGGGASVGPAAGRGAGVQAMTPAEKKAARDAIDAQAKKDKKAVDDKLKADIAKVAGKDKAAKDAKTALNKKATDDKKAIDAKAKTDKAAIDAKPTATPAGKKKKKQ